MARLRLMYANLKGHPARATRAERQAIEWAIAHITDLQAVLRKARDFAEDEVENREASGGLMTDYVNEAQDVVDAIDAALLWPRATTTQAVWPARDGPVDPAAHADDYIALERTVGADL